MDESHDDQNFKCKIKKTWSKTCVFCCKKYPIPISIVILYFLLYLFFPLVYKIVIYSSPLVGFSLLVHRVLSAKDRQKSKQVETDDRRKKYARSRRSFKSVYSDRSRLIRQNTPKKCDKNVDEKDNIFSKSLHELLAEKKSKDKVRFMTIPGKDECSSSNGKVKNVNPQVVDNDGVESDDKPKDRKVVQWTEDDQKNGMDLGLAEADRNKRLQSLMVRRRSRKNLGFEESESTGYNDNVKISAVKTTKINPFLECKSGDKRSPGSAPSSMIKRSNPFDIPYDPYEEKLDLTGDNFQQEFTLGQPKEPVFSRHQSFNLGALSPSFIANGKHDIPYYKDLSDKQKSDMGFVTSTLDNEGDNKHIQQDGTISDDSINSNHTKEEEAAEIKHQEIDSYNERKADINFFYGSNKRVHHAVSYSMVSDMQVELSEEDAVPTLDDLDIEKDREIFLNSSNAQTDSEMNENSKVLNSDTIQSNHIQEPHGADQSSMAQAAPDGLTELAVGQASVDPSSPKSVLQREFSTDPASPYNFINEVQHLDNHIRQSDSSDNALHQSNNDSGEHPFRDRDIDNLQDQN